ncbi:MAG TPA: NADP-dependent oxidoreductase [Jatrophihabitans sp.]|jgi:NADPH:quinone reductase-like Zn-dependent oxidoreductase|uniref:quinone oxidoreductase family protein n=1 Tax=Jatrophihabitans sp. TaxID=1932789 RepID=UPI002E019F77|nr:NADP-dependent oxidoreductase [Jatrophihabitans sp.]
MTTSVLATAFGGPEVLSAVESPTPEPGAGEIRIAVRAAGVNPIDHKAFSGLMGADPSGLPKPVGAEVAGVVTAIGAGVDRVAVGDEVIAYPVTGGYSTDVVTAAANAVAKPAAMSWEQAGGLLLTGATAVHALTAAGVKEGETVLIHGASGGVGLPAVQLALGRGATVIATAGPTKHDLLRRLGAIPVEYGDGLADRVRAAAPQGIDAALDLVGTDEAVETSLELVADRRRIVTIAAFGRALDDGITLIGGGPGADPGTEIRSAARTQLTEAFATGRLELFVARTYPLAEAADALRDIQSGHTTGKIVLIP